MKEEDFFIERRSFQKIAVVSLDSDRSFIFNFGSDYHTKKIIELLIKSKYDLFFTAEAEAALSIPKKTKEEDILPEDEFPEYN